MPVPFLVTASVSQLGQMCFALETFSISLTRFLRKRPYLGPNLPALPVTLPFALCLLELAIFTKPRNFVLYILFLHPY